MSGRRGWAAPQPPPCNPADAQWVCGQQTPEDIVALPGERWVLASAYAGTGGINLIDVGKRASTRVFPGSAVKLQPDRKTYPDCPGPPQGTSIRATSRAIDSTAHER